MATQRKTHKRAGRPAGGGGQAKVLDAAELLRVEKCLAGTRTELRDRAMFCLQYATGMRAGELAALDVGDVLNGGTIRREFRLGTDDTKYCRARTIYLESPKAINAVLAYLRDRNLWLAKIPSAAFWMRNLELTGIGSERNLHRRTGRASSRRCASFSNWCSGPSDP